MRSLFLGVAAGTCSFAGAAFGQAPALMPITALDQSARNYVTQSGSVIAQAGTADPDALIGRAVPCRTDAGGRYVLQPQVLYQLPIGTRYVADANTKPEPLTILAQGSISGRLDAGPLSASGGAQQLTRVDISENVRLSIDLSEGDNNLNRGAILRLAQLDGILGSGFTHWCVIRAVSSWTVRYEGYLRRNFTTSATGLWITNGNFAYAKDGQGTVPYTVITLGITPYPTTWVKQQANLLLNPSAATALIAPPPAAPPVTALQGALSVQSVSAGDRVSEVLATPQ